MGDLNFEQARFNMIEQQIRTWEVLDQRVLDVFAQTPREEFVPERYRELAFADVQIPLEHGEVMMPPMLEGRLLQALALTSRDDVLEIGTGSGYLTACLSHLTHTVHSLEIHADLSAVAREKLQLHGFPYPQTEVADALRKPLAEQHYDAVVITGSMDFLPPIFQNALAIGGRLFAVLGKSPLMEAVLITRVGEQAFTREVLFETYLPPLVYDARAPQFFV